MLSSPFSKTFTSGDTVLMYRCEVEVILSHERSRALELNRSELPYWISHLPAINSYLPSLSLNHLICKMEPTILIYSFTHTEMGIN